MASAPFWVALACQLIIVVGYFWFYRKEQLGKSMHGLWRETFRIDMCASTSMMAISFLHLPCTHEVYS